MNNLSSIFNITNPLLISLCGSILATITALITRLIFYRIRDSLPAGALFNKIKDSENPCLVFILRMKDIQKSGTFITPIPNYLAVQENINDFEEVHYEERKNTPWVSSALDTQGMAHIFNVLGRIGRTKNIQVTFPDRDFDKWDAPMFLLGGTWKTSRALKTCRHYYEYGNNGFKLIPEDKTFNPQSNIEEDMGLLEKMINPSNGFPIWIIAGRRGAGTTAAAYTLLRLWRYLGLIYGKKPFGLLVSFSDRDGWQTSKIISIYPNPNWMTKLLHPIAWNKLKKY